MKTTKNHYCESITTNPSEMESKELFSKFVSSYYVIITSLSRRLQKIELDDSTNLLF